MATAVLELTSSPEVSLPTTPAKPAAPSAPAKPKSRALVVLPLLVALAAGGAGIAYVSGRGKETTDDAQVEGHVASVSPRVAGQVKRVLVRDNQAVKAGDVLVELDDRELVAKLDAAKADVAAAEVAGSVMHYSALEIGKVFLVAGTVSLVVMPMMGRLSPRVDGRLLLLIGVTSVAASQLVASHLTQAAGFWDLVRPNMIRSFGLGFIFIPVSVLALSGLSPSERGNATGLFNLTRELGGSLGTALMGMLVSNDIKRFGSHLGESISVYNPIAMERLAAVSHSLGSQTFQHDLVGESVLSLKVTTQALVLSFENGFRYTALAMALGLFLLLLLNKPKVGGPAPSGVH